MSAPVTADRLKSFLERIERLLEERAGIQSDIKDIFSEAKGVGYDVKTMRRLIQIRAQDSAERAEQAALLDTYMHALGMIDRIESRVAAGESIRQIEKAEGVPRSTVHRVSQKAKGKTGGAEMGHPKPDVILPPEVEALPAHNPDTGEIDSAETADRGGDPAGVAEGAPVGQVPLADQGSPGDADYDQHRQSAWTEFDPVQVTRQMASMDASMETSTLTAPAADTRTFDEIAGPIPERLRRTA